jgi:hypothetical protein
MEERALMDLVEWRLTLVPSTSYEGDVELLIGEVGRDEPMALIVAGIHGDEGPWGAWAIRKLLEGVSGEELFGSLRVVPVANPTAMEADSRVSPLDHLDLNRVFPGDPQGSHTERLSAILVEEALDGVKFVFDLHGGGSWCVNSFAFAFPNSEVLAEAFDPPFLVERAVQEGSMTGYAQGEGSRVVAVEMGGKSKNEEIWADRIAQGLKRALGLAGILTPPAQFETSSRYVGFPTVLRPSRGGILLPSLGEDDVGRVFPQGTVLGRLVDPASSRELEVFRAPFPETAILLLRPTLSCLDGGAMTYVVAPLREGRD